MQRSPNVKGYKKKCLLMSCSRIMSEVQDLDLLQQDSSTTQQPNLGIAQRKPLSKSLAKQWLCAIGYLQLMQHHLLFGDMREGKLSSLSLLTADARNRRRVENQRKNHSFVDAAKHAPELTDKNKERAFLDFCLQEQGQHKQLSGIRTAAMNMFNQRTAQRGQQVRDVRVCQRLNLDVPASDDESTSRQPMEVLAFTKDTGKTSSGDSKSIVAFAHTRT